MQMRDGFGCARVRANMFSCRYNTFIIIVFISSSFQLVFCFLLIDLSFGCVYDEWGVVGLVVVGVERGHS